MIFFFFFFYIDIDQTKHPFEFYIQSKPCTNVLMKVDHVQCFVLFCFVFWQDAKIANLVYNIV